MKNFLRLDGLSILSVQYMYIDYKDYLADSLLAQNHVSATRSSMRTTPIRRVSTR